jgi:Protein of unknown function (DUF3303)
MESSDRRQLDAWLDNWKDVVDFEVNPVISSSTAAARVAPLL